jgi:hypothetical protein
MAAKPKRKQSQQEKSRQRNPKPNQTTHHHGEPPSQIEDQKALAFNTLLSSQETDTHHQRSSGRSPPGQPYKLTTPSQPVNPQNHRPQRSTNQPKMTPRHTTTPADNIHQNDHSPKEPHPGRPPTRRPASRSSGQLAQFTSAQTMVGPRSSVRVRVPEAGPPSGAPLPQGTQNVTWLAPTRQIAVTSDNAPAQGRVSGHFAAAHATP